MLYPIELRVPEGHKVMMLSLFVEFSFGGRGDANADLVGFRQRKTTPGNPARAPLFGGGVEAWPSGFIPAMLPHAAPVS